MTEIGMIGFGHLGSAIATGLLRGKEGSGICLQAFDVRPDALGRRSDVKGAKSAAEVFETCDIVFLCVRPADALSVLESVNAAGKVIISTVAGLAAQDIEEKTGAHVLRIMPNMAVSMGLGAIACAEPDNLTAAERDAVMELLMRLGRTVFVPEDELAAVTGLSGSGPAYCYMLADGMVKGAVASGLDPAAARELAAQTLIGAGAVILAAEESLSELIEKVATPGGTTEAGVRVLSAGDLEALAEGAVKAASKRAEELMG